MKRCTEEMKNWLFDLVNKNLNQEEIIKGFIKHYVMYGYAISKVQDDIHFHTTYELQEGARIALENLRGALEEFVAM